MPIFFDNDSIALSNIWPTNAFNHPVLFMPLRDSLLNTRGAIGAYASDSQTPKNGVMVDGPVYREDGLRLIGGYNNKCLVDGIPDNSVTEFLVSGDGNEVFTITDGWYQLDNSAGSAASFVRASGNTGNLNTHSLSCIGYAVSGTPELASADSSVLIELPDSAEEISLTFTPSGTTNKFTIRCLAGEIARFKLPQMTESTYPLPILPATVSGTIKATEAGNSDGTGVSWGFSDMQEKAWNCFKGIDATPAQGSLFLEWTPGFDAGDLPTTHYNILSNGDAISGLMYFRAAAGELEFKSHDGTNTATATTFAGVADTTYIIGVRWGDLTGTEQFQVSVDGTWGTAADFVGWTLEDYLRLAYDNEELQNIKNLRLFNTPGSLVNGVFTPL